MGVLGGDTPLKSRGSGVRYREVSTEGGLASAISKSSDEEAGSWGSSIVGIGTSAAATEARNCSVGGW